MKTYRIVSVVPVSYPVLRVTFDDGLSGEIDMSRYIGEGPIFEPLEDPAYFDQVAVAPWGHSFGWNLDVLGREIDFGADNVRTQIETQKVHELAERYRSHRPAAE